MVVMGGRHRWRPDLDLRTRETALGLPQTGPHADTAHKEQARAPIAAKRSALRKPPMRDADE
jgi:hypothetical protein